MKSPQEWALALRDNMSAENEWNEWDLRVVACLVGNVQADTIADRVAPLEATITRVREIFPQLQGAIVHGEGGTVAKLMTALGVALSGG